MVSQGVGQGLCLEVYNYLIRMFTAIKFIPFFNHFMPPNFEEDGGA